jgi:hypothetical protein
MDMMARAIHTDENGTNSSSRICNHSIDDVYNKDMDAKKHMDMMTMGIHTAENKTNFKQTAFVIAASMTFLPQRHGCKEAHGHDGHGNSYS